MLTHAEKRRLKTNPNTDGWDKQLERWGIKTNGYRQAKRNEYQRRHQKILFDRKERELENVREYCPQGRMHHLAKQIGRIENILSPKPDWMQPGV